MCHSSYNGYFLQSSMCVYLCICVCVGVHSPQASRGNVIVFNALLTYP